MRGAIHGIWLTTPGGKLHPEVIPNMSAWVADAKEAGFSVMLWTNTQQIDPAELNRAEQAGIVVADHAACKNNPMYKYFYKFMQKGMDGDMTAFAIASDILRMAIMQETPNDMYFIYADPNDIAMPNLKNDLQNLDLNMRLNNLGFSFKITPSITIPHPGIFSLRNDVLIARKENNLNFFRDYLRSYSQYLESSADLYVKPADQIEAFKIVNSISNQITERYFHVSSTPEKAFKVYAQFGDYSELARVVNCDVYLQTKRELEHGSTWLPVNDVQDVTIQAADVNSYGDTLRAGVEQVVEQQPWFNAQTLNHLQLAGFYTLLGATVAAGVFWVLVKRGLLASRKQA